MAGYHLSIYLFFWWPPPKYFCLIQVPCASHFTSHYIFSELSQAAGPLHRHSCYCLSLVLIWLPYHQLSDLLFCLHWTLLDWFMPLWSTSSSLPYALLSVADFILQFCCWAGGLPHGSGCCIPQDLECLLGMWDIYFLGKDGHLFSIVLISRSPSVHPRSTCLFLCLSFLEGSTPTELLEMIPRWSSAFHSSFYSEFRLSMVLLLMILSGRLLVLFHFTYLTIQVSLPKAAGERS